ncbi:MAG TPA: hypothetical protein VFT95_00955 [Micromonosporaceae bacterium]|nr:hypothetical protein [Micromonosporaceae bacterium]
MDAATIDLPPAQADLLRFAAANDGCIHVGGHMPPAERKAADALVRRGMLTIGSGLYGASRRDVTVNGRAWLAAHPEEF